MAGRGKGRRVTGGRHKTIYNTREKAYRALKKKYGNPKAARIANGLNTLAKRKAAGRKAARTRKRRGR